MNPPKHTFWLAIAAILLSSLACNTLLGGGTAATATPFVESNDPSPTPAASEPAPTEDTGITIEEPTATPLTGGGETVDTEYPMPDDAFNVTDFGGGQLNYQTSMPMSDVPAYVRADFEAKGYTERTLLTVISDAAISIVFDGHPSGNAIVVQAVDLGGSTNINFRLEPLP
jgi:hypothetical protein